MHVEVLDVKNQYLPVIPKAINKFFPNIRLIRLSEVNLKTISAHDLRPFPHLRVFISWHNELKSLDGDLFKYTKKLQLVRFNDNAIEKVGDGLLADLELLNEADFRLNPCVNTQAMSRQQILDLKLELSTNCDPSQANTAATKESKIEDYFPNSVSQENDKCELRCSLNKETDKLMTQIAEQAKHISELEKAISEINLKLWK